MRTGNEPQTEAPRRGRATAHLGVLAAACLALGAGCRRDMYDQPKYERYEPSTMFADGTSMQAPPSGTIPRGELRADAHYYTGKVDGKDADTFPFPVDAATLELGRERYQIYCTPCHGRVGNGRGMIVRRGFSPPPTFHSQWLREKPVGHFYDVITNGYGAMYSYAARIPVEHRWAIVAYIRALQYSQDPQDADLTGDDRRKLTEVSR